MHAGRSECLRENTLWFAFYTAVCVALFFRPLRDLINLVRTSETDSHILLIPLITASLLWLFRRNIFQEVRRNWTMFVPFFGMGGFLYFLSWRWGAIVPARYSLELAILSLCFFVFAGFIFIFGKKSFLAGLYPLLLLLLTAPLPGFLLDRLIWWLQLGSAQVTTWIFYLTRTPVLREGLSFTVPGVTIEIAKECSGIRSTMALLITCLVAGYLLLRTVSGRLALLAAALPVLVLKNGIRIATLTLLAIHVDPSFLSGRLHKDGGFVFFGIGLVILLPTLLWLQRAEDKNRIGGSGSAAV
jgi:exosortase